MAKLTLSQAGNEFPVAQYPMPVKGRPVNLKIGDEETEGRVTSARGKTYTYFRHAGGEFYVPGELAADEPITFALPEGFKVREAKSRAEQYEALKAKRQAAKAEAGDAAPAEDGVEATSKPNPRSRKKSKEQEDAAKAWGVDGEQAAQ